LSDFVRAASTKDVPEGKMKKVIVGTQQVLVVNVKGTYHAIGNVCTHMGGPLDQGFSAVKKSSVFGMALISR